MSTSCGRHSDMLHSKSTQKNRRKSDIIYKEKGLRGEKYENTADTAAYDLYSEDGLEFPHRRGGSRSVNAIRVYPGNRSVDRGNGI